MAPSKKKRSSRDMSDDSDDDSDDDLMNPVFATGRSSKRGSANDAEAKKKKRMAQMNALLDSGKAKLERESRMDEIHQNNIMLLRDDSLDEKKNDKKGGSTDDPSMSDTNNIKGKDLSSLQQKENQNNNNYQNQPPKDSKETVCLGSRSTLRFSRVISFATTDEKSSPGVVDKPRAVTPSWSGFEEALTDLRTILLIDRQQQQNSSSFAPVREELLQSTVTTSPHACRTYLRRRRMCEQEDPELIRRIPVDVLRWLMALACGPIVTNPTGSVNDNSDNSNSTIATAMDTRMTGANGWMLIE